MVNLYQVNLYTTPYHTHETLRGINNTSNIKENNITSIHFKNPTFHARRGTSKGKPNNKHLVYIRQE